MKNISIDIETFSSVDLARCGVYKYAESPDFQILLFGYSVDGGEVMEYAQLMADVVMPVWQQSDIQAAKTQVGDLMQLLRQYSAASTDAEKK